jgi:rhodanese-related sulfurtransferase/DNA-binding transcriptional ArsR family regulator
MQKEAKRQFKNRLFDQFARIGRALGNAHRIELLDVLAQGERSVEQLAAETDLSVANASQHLQVLRQAELIVARREGVRVLYALAGPEVFALYQALRATGEARLAEIQRVVATFLTDRAQMEVVGPDELRRRLADGEVTLLDVRPALEYRQGHIAGAQSIPVDALAERMTEIPGDRPVVAYCRGPYCVYADEAVALLRARGVHAARLAIGYPDWHAAGLPVTSDE